MEILIGFSACNLSFSFMWMKCFAICILWEVWSRKIISVLQYGLKRWMTSHVRKWWAVAYWITRASSGLWQPSVEWWVAHYEVEKVAVFSSKCTQKTPYPSGNFVVISNRLLSTVLDLYYAANGKLVIYILDNSMGNCRVWLRTPVVYNF